jgi:aspartate/methionine/tyrosine aminotransferase
MRLAPSSYKKDRSGVRAMMERSWARDDVIHLEIGESGLDTAPHILAAAAQASERGENGYSPTPGLPQLRTALADKLCRVNKHLGAKAENVLVTNGGGNALFVIFGTILNADSSILLPNPGWSSFPLIARGVAATPEFYAIRESAGFLPDPDEIRTLICDNTRALVVNSPSNPLGKTIPESLVRELYQLCEEYDLWLVSDECYDQIDFNGDYFSFGSLEKEPERVLSVFSFSKVYAMTGWRVGYCHLPSELVDPVLALLEPSILCVNTPAQYAALAALEGSQDELKRALDCYKGNRELVLQGLKDSGFKALTPDGGFYVWLKINNNGISSEDVAIELLEKHCVVVTPGTAFGPGGEGYLRISLATTPELLSEGLKRLLCYQS